jgi:predicted transcriptional regulator
MNSQQSLADLFGLTQGWVSQIKQKHPEARLVLVDGATKSIEYSVNKVKHIEE